MSHLDDLKAEVRAGAENRPGVYRMLGPSGEVLYVGKSIRLRGRLLSYFRADRSEKAGKILTYTRRIDWEAHPSEFAALLREFRLIRRWRPVFNVVHKKQRAICFIKITAGAAPRLGVTRHVKADGASYFGPLLGIGRVGAAARELVDLLALRTCAATTPLRFADQRELFATALVPLCVRPELARCSAPCAGGCTEREYARQVEEARRFLRGESDLPLLLLRERLERAATRLQYEYAAELRDRLDRLRGVRDELLRIDEQLTGLSFVYAPEGHDGEVRWYALRRGRVVRELRPPDEAEARRRAASALRRVYRRSPRRLSQLGPDAVAETLLVARWFRRNPEERRRAVALDTLRLAG